MPVSLEAALTDSSWRGEQLVTALHKIGKKIAQKDIKPGNKSIQSLIDYAMNLNAFLLFRESKEVLRKATDEHFLQYFLTQHSKQYTIGTL